MLSGGWAHYAPLSGIVFAALLLASFVVSGSSPDTNDSTQKVVQVWSDNDTKQIVGAILSALAIVPFIWFLGSLRSALRVAEGGTGRLASIAFGAGLVLGAFNTRSPGTEGLLRANNRGIGKRRPVAYDPGKRRHSGTQPP